MAISTFVIGCDSELNVKGKVLELVNAPSTEKGSVYITNISTYQTHNIHISETPPQDINLQPIPSANISFWYITEKGGIIPVRGGPPTPESNIISSDYLGNFKELWVVGPGKSNMKIIVQKDGYYTVERIFPFDGGDPGTFDFTVLLVPKP